jgi:hypothetical protein
MAKTIDDLFVYLRILTDFLLAFWIIFGYSGTLRKQRGSIAILVYCIYNILFFFIGEQISDRIGRIIFYSSYTFIEYLIFSYFILLYIKNKVFKKILISSSILFVVSLITVLLFTEFKIIDTIPIGIETILILIFSFYYLYEQMSDLSNEFIYNKFAFWIITGFLIYLAGSFFIYVFAAQVDKEILQEYWFLTNAFYSLKNIIFALGYLVVIKKIKNPKPMELSPYLN